MIIDRLTPAVFGLACLFAHPAQALDEISFVVRGNDDGLEKTLRDASLLLAAEAEGRTNANDLIATSLAEYERLLNTLYSEGYYGGVVRVRVNGVEAANIETFNVPDRIDTIEVQVNPTTQFRFGTARIVPLPRYVQPLDEFATGEIARSGVIQDAAAKAVDDWRDRGHAKAEVSDQSIVADHRTGILNAKIGLRPGPVVTFGELRQTTNSDVRAERIQRIAGLPTGERFSPDELNKSAERLRRTGAFSSVAMREGELDPNDQMDILLSVADMKPRRFGFGAEVSSLEGVGLSGFWMHRNLLGGAERLRIDADISGITPSLNNLDVEVGARLDVPAAFGTDNDAFVQAEAAMLREPTYTAWQASGTAGVHRYISDTMEAELGVGYTFSRVTDSQGTRNFSLIQLPTMFEWDRRNDALNPTRGSYVETEIEPFYDLNYGPGAWGKVDVRLYKGFGEDEKFVIAARGQVGTVFGQPAALTHPEYLFYSGGGGTVRGQPYASLAFPAGGGTFIGGQGFAGAQFEARFQATDKIGVVGFYDVAYIGAEGLFDSNNLWHSGAGLGVRYNTGLGPIRLDVGLPVTGGNATDGLQFRDVQIYVGIGQSF